MLVFCVEKPNKSQKDRRRENTTAVSLYCRLNHMLSKISAATGTAISVKNIAEVHAVLRQPHGGHEGFLRPIK